MSHEGKTIHPVVRAVLAIAALVMIVVFGNMLVATLGIGHKALDLTEDKVHSLSDGTREILKELKTPVIVRYYATRSTDYMPEEVKLHMRRVDDLLSEYGSLSDKLQIENLDPQPDTDAEDSANLDGISGQTINNENLYFGLAITCLDRTSTIPFLDPRDETMLEYEISRRIAEVSATRKPVIGLMSGINLAGGPAMMPGQPGTQPWVIYNQLSQDYEIEDLTMTPESIDPEKYTVVLVFHPAGITPEAEFAIDQYVLQGGTVIACVDPYSVAAQMLGGGNPMMGGGMPTSSTLPTLLEAWGVEMPTNQVVGDSTYATTMSGGRPALAVLTVPQDGMPQEDSVVTRDLTSVTLFLPGGMTKPGGAGVAMKTLVRASGKSGLVDSMPASQLDPSLLTRFQSDDKVYDLVLHLSGSFKSAFPDGKPGEDAADDASAEGEDEAKEAEDGDEPEQPGHLTEATQPGNVFLISDVDAFYDRFAFSVQRLGNLQLAQPINGNSSLLFNLIDQAASSTHLIGARSRAAISRPFTRLNDLEAEFNRRYGEKLEKKQEELDGVSNEINELVQQRRQGDTVFLDSDIEAKIREAREKQVSARKELREMEKDLRREKDGIAARIIGLNLFGMPLVVLAIGLVLFGIRRSRTRAR